MAEQKWTMRGEYMESCNCDYLCPVHLIRTRKGPVTTITARRALVFRIDPRKLRRDQFGGLKFALLERSGKGHGGRRLDFCRRGRRKCR